MLAPFARLPNEQLRIPAVMEQLPAPVPPSMLHDVPALVGRASKSATPFAIPGPPLETVIRKPIGSPALTEDASGVFVTDSPGACTTTLAEALSDPSFDVLTEAVLSTGESAGVADVVPEEMCTVSEAPEAMVPKLHERAPATIEQLPAPVPPSIDQLNPASLGRVSETVTPLATPGPEFVTVIANPMASPAETGEA